VYPPVEARIATPIMVGCEPMTVAFEDVSVVPWDEEDPIVDWVWTFGDGTTSNDANPIHVYNQGQYQASLSIITQAGCTSTVQMDTAIKVHETPEANYTYVVSDNSAFEYGNVQFSDIAAGGAPPYTYQWVFGDGSESDLPSPEHRYLSNDLYMGDPYQSCMIITDLNGCIDTICQGIHIDYFSGLYIPNALMPNNGVGEQRVFLPKGKSLTSYRMQIFDKNGNLLFESSQLNPADGSPAEAWDGTYRGVLVPQGVYIYRVEAIFSDDSAWYRSVDGGKKTTTGTVTVIR
jgi:hypothetical protein